MSFNSGNLRFRLIVLVLFAVIPMTGLLFYSSFEQRRLEIADLEGDVLTLAEFAAREEDQLFDGTRQFLKCLAHYLDRPETDPANLNPNLSDLMTHYLRYQNIGAVNAQGVLYCSAIPFNGILNASEKLWFQRAVATKKFTISDYEPGIVTGRPAMVFAYPIISSDEEVQGVAFAALDIYWLNQFRLGIEKDLPNGATISEVDSEGTILVHHPDPDAWIGRSLDQTPLFEALRSKQKGMIAVAGPDGRKRLYAFSNMFSALKNQTLYLLVGMPEESLYGEANRLLIHNLAILGIVITLVILAAWFGSDIFVLRPVRAMLKAASRLGNGDLSARTGLPQRTGELNELAQAFDAMASALERREEQRRQAEAELRGSQEQLRNLSSHLESVREEERTRLAREIHDELGQGLTALKMDLSWITKRLEPGQQPISEKIRSMDGLVDETIRTVQRLSGELRPGLLDDLGLAAAIEWQTEEFQKRAGIACDVRLALGDTALSREHATVIFRIFQETLTNVLRHARATRVSVLLQVEDNRLVLEVGDNGRGITEEEARGPRAFGLIGMRERLLALKGQLVIHGRPGHGTTVTVTVPLTQGGNAYDQDPDR